MSPVLVLVAGPDASGKSTLVAGLREEAWARELDYVAAESLTTDRFRELVEGRGPGLVVETSLAGAGAVSFLRRAKASGCFVRMFFVGTSDPCINASRIVMRVLDGGESVPIDRMLRSYVRSMANLSAAIRLADRVYVYDNSVDGAQARLAARIASGRLCRLYGALPEWVADTTLDLDRHWGATHAA